jgi:hypothetical protein
VEVDTAVAVNTVAVATVAVDTVEAETAAAVNTVAVAMVVAATVAVGDTAVVVASLKGLAAPICAGTGNESVPASMGRRRLSGRRACDNQGPFGIAGRARTRAVPRSANFL